jgi:hypothetical protein
MSNRRSAELDVLALADCQWNGVLDERSATYGGSSILKGQL